MAQTKISNQDLKKPLTGENITLGSGINILNSNSGTNNLGSAALPFGTVYANNIVGTGSFMTGFIASTGGTLTGSLNITGSAAFGTATSGVGNIGSASKPFNTIFASNVVIGGLDLNTAFVNTTGDTMTGPLAISSGNLSVANGTITSSGNISTTAGNILVAHPFSLYTTQILPATSAGISLSDTNGLGGIINMTSVGNGVGNAGKINLTLGVGAGGAGGEVNISAAGAGTTVQVSGNALILSNTVNLLTAVSGGSNVGSPAKPFGNIYAQNLVGPSGGFLNIAGGQMDGTLNFATGVGITFDGSGNSNIGEPGFPVGTLYVDNIVSSGSTGEFVNVTGDTMTGDLKIQTRLNVGSANTLFGTNSSVFGSGNIASGNNSHAGGLNSIAYGTNSFAHGNGSIASGNNSVAIGNNTLSGGEAKAYGPGSVALAGGKTFGRGSFAVGDGATGGGPEAHGDGAFAVGQSTQAFGEASAAFGSQTVASGDYSIAAGYSSVAQGDYSFAGGIIAVATGLASISYGNDTKAYGNYSYVFGYNSSVSGTRSMSVGGDNVVIGDFSIALGQGVTNTANNSFVFGQGGTVDADNSVVFGQSSNGGFPNSVNIAMNGGNSNPTGDTILLAADNGVYLDSGFPTHLYAISSGTNDIGSVDVPFGTLYVNNIVSSGSSGEYVNVTGDTMTGDLTMSNADIIVNSPSQLITNNISGTNPTIKFIGNVDHSTTGFYDLYSNGDVEVLAGYLATSSKVLLLDNNSPSGSTFIRNTEPGSYTQIWSRERLFIGTDGSLPKTKVIDIINTSGSRLLLSGTQINTSNSIVPIVSGVDNLGSASLPFSGTFTKKVNGNVVTSAVYNEVPTGAINGVNSAYTVLFAPYSTSLQLFKNGLYMAASGIGAGSIDFALSGSTITFVTPPVSGSTIISNYNYLV